MTFDECIYVADCCRYYGGKRKFTERLWNVYEVHCDDFGYGIVIYAHRDIFSKFVMCLRILLLCIIICDVWCTLCKRVYIHRGLLVLYITEDN